MKKIISLLLTLILLLGCFLSMWSCNNSKNDRDDEDDETGDEIKGDKEDNNGKEDNNDKEYSENKENGKEDEYISNGACEYLNTRDITGRDIKYVEMLIKGYGKVVILLDATTAPETVANFISLVEEGFYDGLTFHRVIKDFMIQGGDPKGNGTGGNTDKDGNEINIKGEFDLNGHPNDISHKHGVISMARSNDPNSASSQFFICNADATSLDGSYAAFGYVVEGLNVVDKLTEDVFPKTYLSSYYYDFTIDPYYGVTRHELWNYFGNGAFENQNDQPIIEYIKVLDSRSK